MVAFGLGTTVGVALEVGKIVAVGLALGDGMLVRGAANSTSSALSLPSVRVPATRTRSPRCTPWVATGRLTGPGGWAVIIARSMVWAAIAVGSVTVAVELATVIVMSCPPVLMVMVVGLATGVVSWRRCWRAGDDVLVGTMSPVDSAESSRCSCRSSRPSRFVSEQNGRTCT